MQAPEVPVPPIIERRFRSHDDALMRALGEHNKLNAIKQKMNATYPPPPAPGEKIYSSRPESVDL